ncbi:hypothetical protein MJ1HA_2439 [Metallosphaera sedula]|nr:hypothetical protein MJ1HA_2439 [Metallosphaera sedula]
MISHEEGEYFELRLKEMIKLISTTLTDDEKDLLKIISRREGSNTWDVVNWGVNSIFLNFIIQPNLCNNHLYQYLIAVSRLLNILNNIYYLFLQQDQDILIIQEHGVLLPL